MMNIVLWIAQVFLSLTLCAGAVVRILIPERLPFRWVVEHPTLNMVTSLLDLLAGMGLLLPALLRVKPGLTIYAALGVVATMLGAIVFHLMRGESGDIGFNIFVLVVAAFVAYGRARVVPLK